MYIDTMDVLAELSNGSDSLEGCDGDPERPSCLLTPSQVTPYKLTGGQRESCLVSPSLSPGIVCVRVVRNLGHYSGSENGHIMPQVLAICAL